MAKSMYVVNPAADFPTYFSAEVYQGWGLYPAATMADLSIATVAALAPRDFDVQLCDENISRVDLDSPADFVALTGKISQRRRMETLAREFRARGKTVLIGGPYASLCPDAVAEHCDVLVRGEIEEIAPGLFSDLRANAWKDEYVGTRPSLDLAPAGRWDLYPNERAKSATVQTSRGCPFECEFCDVIQYLGRQQRHKPVANVLAELDAIHRHGYRSVFLADDNFTIARRRAKELLVALADWNRRLDNGKVTFITQLSIDAAKDEEMLRLCAEAGLTHAFIGIETPNEESLRESRKPQNLGVNLIDQVQRFYAHGIMVYGGMIVGFDSDGLDIFERQYEFATRAAIPIVSLGALVAPAATPLYERMRREGRLDENGSEMAAMPWSTNIVPSQMSREELLRGTKWLANRLYHPTAFGERMLDFMARLGPRRDPRSQASPDQVFGLHRSVDRDTRRLLRRLSRLGPEESTMMRRVLDGASGKPGAFEFAVYALLQYAQIRYMYERGQFWETHLADEAMAFAPGHGTESPAATLPVH